jgi:hypothetical protein
MSLTDEELCNLIREGLYVNEANAENLYYSKKSAEGLERVVYYCPHCGFSEFESSGNIIECKKCHLQARYLPTKELEGVGYDFPYRFVNEWYEAQNDFINSQDTSLLTDAPVWVDKADYFEVIPYEKKKTIAEKCKIELYGDKITVSDGDYTDVFNFDECFAVTVLGKNKVNIYRQDKVYQLKGGKELNGIKFVHFYNRYKNIKKGDADSKFLGL